MILNNQSYSYNLSVFSRIKLKDKTTDKLMSVSRRSLYSLIFLLSITVLNFQSTYRPDYSGRILKKYSAYGGYHHSETLLEIYARVEA